MKAPATNVNVLSSKACEERLQAIGSEDVHVASLDRAPEAPAVRMRVFDDAVDGDAGSDSCGGEPAAPVGDVPEEEVAVVRDRSPSVDGDGDGGPMFYPYRILGAVLHREHRLSPKGEWLEGLRVTCPTHGQACRKFRSRHLRVAQEGFLAPVFYLGCWLQRGRAMTVAEHKGYVPTVADVRAFMMSDECPWRSSSIARCSVTCQLQAWRTDGSDSRLHKKKNMWRRHGSSQHTLLRVFY